MNCNLPTKSNPNQDNNKIVQKFAREFLRQYTQMHYLNLFVTAASFAIALAGVGLLYTNKVPEGTVTTGIGVLTTLGSNLSANQKKEELQQEVEYLEKLRQIMEGMEE